MTIKTLTAAAAVIAGTIGFAGKADAQVYYSGYSTPSYVYPSSYSSHYGGGLMSNGYTYANPGYTTWSSPVYGSTYSSGYSPYYGHTFSSGYSPYYGSSYSSPYYGNYGTGYYNNNMLATPYSGAYYSGYNNLYNTGVYGLGVGTTGTSFGGRRLWRW